MASTLITVTTGLQIVSQLLTLIQNSNATGTPIDAASWEAALNARDAALAKLDRDIAAAIAEQAPAVVALKGKSLNV
jgi:hypothetical protein